jgi:uncharacterized protein
MRGKTLSRTTVVITGASSGIGAVFARRLAPEHNLILVARRRDRQKALADEFSAAYGTQTEVIEADLSTDAGMKTVADRISSEEHLALLVNNAGFGTRGLFWESSLESQDRMHQLHVIATMRLTHAALGNMIKRNFGAIINVASVSAFVRTSGNASYSATKSWMTNFTEGIYLDLKSARSSVAVQVLCPGYTYSEFHDKAGVDRSKTASKAWWFTAEEVVDASLAGLAKRKLFVIPGWRYRLFTAAFSKLPSALRLAAESAIIKKNELPASAPVGSRPLGPAV